VEGTPETGLHGNLTRVIDVCQETLDAYAQSRPEIASSKFAGVVFLAMAGFETAIRTPEDDPRRGVSLMIASSLGRDAAEAVRQHGPNDDLLRCAEACERGATLCETALGERAGNEALRPPD
jgi:hypothetical protein